MPLAVENLLSRLEWIGPPPNRARVRRRAVLTQLDHQMIRICHAVVGAVSLKPEEVELGRKYAREIIEELQFAD